MREVSAIFAETIKEFAGAAQTESEKANILKFMPHAQMSISQLKQTIEDFAAFAENRGASLRNPNQPTEQAAPAENKDRELTPEELAEYNELVRQQGET